MSRVPDRHTVFQQVQLPATVSHGRLFELKKKEEEVEDDDEQFTFQRITVAVYFTYCIEALAEHVRSLPEIA